MKHYDQYKCSYPSEYTSLDEWIGRTRRKRRNSDLLCLLFAVAYTAIIGYVAICIYAGGLVGLG
jgi:hypothetical protein